MTCKFSVPAVIRKRATRKAHIDENNNEKNEAVVATAFLELRSVWDSNEVEVIVGFDPRPSDLNEENMENLPASHLALIKLLRLADDADFLDTRSGADGIVESEGETVH